MVEVRQWSEVEAGIKDTLSRYFESLSIVAVYVAPDLGHDGDDVLWVDVVFEGSKLKEEDARRSAGATRTIRLVLEDVGINHFPVMSFISKADYDRGLGRRASRRQ